MREKFPKLFWLFLSPSNSVVTENKKATKNKPDDSPVVSSAIAKTEAVVTESREIKESKTDDSQVIESDKEESFTSESKAEAISEQETGEQEEVPAEEYPEAIFKAIGLITGQVKFDEEGKSSLTLGRKQNLSKKHQSF